MAKKAKRRGRPPGSKKHRHKRKHGARASVQGPGVHPSPEIDVELVSALPQPPGTLILAGSGEFLMRAALPRLPLAKVRCISLADQLGPAISQAACAHALAVLASESTDAPR